MAPYRSFVLPIPERGGYIEMYVEMSAPIRYPGRSVWSGTIGGKGNRAGGEFTFLLEQYGTIEPAILLLLVIFFFIAIVRTVRTDRGSRNRLVYGGFSSGVPMIGTVRTDGPIVREQPRLLITFVASDGSDDPSRGQHTRVLQDF